MGLACTTSHSSTPLHSLTQLLRAPGDSRALRSIAVVVMPGREDVILNAGVVALASVPYLGDGRRGGSASPPNRRHTGRMPSRSALFVSMSFSFF